MVVANYPSYLGIRREPVRVEFADMCEWAARLAIAVGEINVAIPGGQRHGSLGVIAPSRRLFIGHMFAHAQYA